MHRLSAGFSPKTYLVLLLCALLFPACDSGSHPVAPAATTGVTMVMTANPAAIPLDGTSAVQVEILQDGLPVLAGTEIQLSVDLGSIEPLVETDSRGIARATFTADGRPGVATVMAISGTQTASETITIATNPITAAFSATAEGLTVIFVDQSVAASGSSPPTSWQWDFGDGATSSEPDPVHTYAEADTYFVTLTVANADASDSLTKPITVGDVPVAAFTFEIEGLTVVFTDQSTGGPTSWAWQFGDGTESTSQNPLHTYGASGTYFVRLTATNDAGQSTVTQSIALSSGPTASFSATIDGLRVAFTDLSSGNPTSWSWAFGDGGTSKQPNPVHNYSAAGTYLVQLTVSNSNGESSTSQTVTVAERPTADFSFVVNGLNVDFTDESSNFPTSWTWDFGDGTPVVTGIQNPTHTYAAAGSYDVILLVSNSEGESTITRTVTVP